MLVLVYGTLMSGMPNHHLMKSATFLGPDRTEARTYRMIDLGAFPVAQEQMGKTIGTEPVMGELYEVNASTLADLDRLEGHPDFYRRKHVRLASGERAWLYLGTAMTLAGTRARPTVPGGDWRSYLAARSSSRPA